MKCGTIERLAEVMDVFLGAMAALCIASVAALGIAAVVLAIRCVCLSGAAG